MAHVTVKSPTQLDVLNFGGGGFHCGGVITREYLLLLTCLIFTQACHAITVFPFLKNKFLSSNYKMCVVIFFLLPRFISNAHSNLLKFFWCFLKSLSSYYITITHASTYSYYIASSVALSFFSPLKNIFYDGLFEKKWDAYLSTTPDDIAFSSNA